MSDATATEKKATAKKATAKKAPAKRAGAVKAPADKQPRSALGDKLRALRERRGVTQKQVADELGYTTAQFVSNWERGISEPPLESIVQLATFLQTGRNGLLEAIFASRAARLACDRAEAFAKYGVKK